MTTPLHAIARAVVRPLRRALRLQVIHAKWRRDRRRLPLTDEHWEIYRNLHIMRIQSCGTWPDLVRPDCLNDLIQWVKLFDQRHEQVVFCDKHAVRAYIAGRLGEGYTVPLLHVVSSLDALDLDRLPTGFALKVNSDCGSVRLIRDKRRIDWQATCEALRAASATHYGWHLGEWAYRFVPRRFLVEELLAPESPDPPADYKFYCIHGRVIHVMRSTRVDGRRSIVRADPTGRSLARASDAAGASHPGPLFQRPRRWDDMVAAAETLSAGHTLLRADFYEVDGRMYVGELTQFPASGMSRREVFTAPGEHARYLPLEWRPPLVGDYLRAEGRGR